MASTAETLKSLNSAREIVLRDHTLYSQIVPGVLQVIAPAAQLELRRWGSEFLAEAFASQVVTMEEKQKLSLIVLDILKGYLTRKEAMGEEEDISVVKSAVQCAASLYPFVFRHTLSNASDKETWNQMANIKSSILRRMDSASPGVRICCIKFVACVVQTQTPGLITDPRRPDLNEISLALVPRDHPVVSPANLEAEASGLLDRLLGMLQENLSDPLIVTATFNSLSTLVHRRASVSSRILTTILSFNPLALTNKPMTGRDKVAVKSMTRTTMSFLLNYLKRNPNNTFAGRIQQQVERLKHNLSEAFSDSYQLKRSAPDEPTDGLDDAKRQRLDYNVSNGLTLQQQDTPDYPPLPQGPISVAQLWTLTNDTRVTSFEVQHLPLQAVAQLVPAIFHSLSRERIDEAINVVRRRWLDLNQGSSESASDAPRTVTGDEDDDDYDPSLMFGGDTDAVLNKLDQMPPERAAQDVAIGPFHLPPPSPLTEQERKENGKTALTRVFGTLDDLDRESKSKAKQQEEGKGFNCLAGAGIHDRDGWLTLLTRLATRTPFDLDADVNVVKQENEDMTVSKNGHALDLASSIREALLNYVMENFRKRIDVAIMWLNEEWYSDRLLQKLRDEANSESPDANLPNYWRCTLRLMDAMMPYFDVKDGRILIRLLSEMPAINRDVFLRVKQIALDPERVQISSNALLYLVMFRPPVRAMALDCGEEMWKENVDARSAVKKILDKWRPNVLEQEPGSGIKSEA